MPKILLAGFNTRQLRKLKKIYYRAYRKVGKQIDRKKFQVGYLYNLIDFKQDGCHWICDMSVQELIGYYANLKYPFLVQPRDGEITLGGNELWNLFYSSHNWHYTDREGDYHYLFHVNNKIKIEAAYPYNVN